MPKLSEISDGPYRELGPIHHFIIQSVALRRSAEWIADHLSNHTDGDYSARTIRRYFQGLAGKPVDVKKYRFNQEYLKPVANHPDNAVNYRVNEQGREVIRHYDIPSDLTTRSDFDLGFSSELSGGEVRPHKCWWREEISEFDVSGGRVDWGGRRAVLVEKDIDFNVVEKELPNREQSVRGESLWVKGRKVLLFENSVLIKYGLERSDDGIFDVLDEWWRARNEIVDWVESTFGVRLKSTPLDISMPLSTSEWGDVRNEFAEWIRDNPVFQDDSANSLFEVKADNGERIFHVDTSPTDGLGNDLAEGEFPHSQFGAEHIVNMKQAVKWMATLGVKPADFSAAVWTRNNRDELEKAVEFDPEELDELSKRVESNRELIDAAGSRIKQNETSIERVGKEVEQLDDRAEGIDDELSSVEDVVRENQEQIVGNRRLVEAAGSRIAVNEDSIEQVESELERLDDRAESIGDELSGVEDVVRCNEEQVAENRGLIDGTREGLEQVRQYSDALTDAVEGNRRGIKDLVNRQEGYTQRVQDVEDNLEALRNRTLNVSGVVEMNRQRGIARGEQIRLLKQRNQLLLDELTVMGRQQSTQLELLQEIHREQQKTIWQKAKEKTSSMVESVKSKLSGLF